MSSGDAGAHDTAMLAAYSGCGATVRRFVTAGRLGPIGHVACLDRCSAQVGEGGKGYWSGRGGPLLAEVCTLLGTRAQDVIARIDEDHAVTEAYVATENGMHVHFSGNWRAAAESHCLWIEGAAGSLRTDGGVVWWRKRGWRFFVPVRLGAAPRRGPLAPAERGSGIAAAAMTSSTTRCVAPLGSRSRAAVS